jgi:DinB superfamily
MLVPETLSSLASAPAEVARLYARIPPQSAMFKPQSWEGIPGEQFSALEMLCHLRDIEIGYQQRFRRTIEEENPLLPSLDGYAIAREKRYAEADAANALESFRLAREVTLQRIARFRPSDLSRTAMFEGHGPVTLRGLVELLCSHDQQHLACLHWLIAKLDGPIA